MTPQKITNEDLRVKHTQRRIVEAMIDLTAQKGFSKISVSDITKYAGINRATFYRHFQDKFDLLDRYAQALYALSEDPSPEEAGTASGSSHQQISHSTQGMVKMFEHIRANARFYQVMLGKNGDPSFAEKIRQYIQKRLRLSLPEGLQKEGTFLDLYLNYMSSGSLGGLVWWLEHDMPYSPEEMAAISQRINTANIKALGMTG